LSSQQRVQGSRSTYTGSETFVSLVDAQEGPYRSQLKQLAINLLCTNRDLPLQMVIGQGNTDFTLQTSAPVEAVRCLAGPTAPRISFVHGRDHGSVAWRLISHLTLNYLSLTDSDDKQGATGLRELLMLYSDLSDSSVKSLTNGITSVGSKAITRPLPLPGPISFGRGVEVTLTCDESSFTGTGAFLLGIVLERFFTKYVSINSFTETVLKTLQRGEIMRWPVRIGQRHVL
jgi:type VI secretion system protein ImpG